MFDRIRDWFHFSSAEGSFVVYMSSSFWLSSLFVSSWERNNCLQSWANQKITTFFSQTDDLGPFWVKILSFCEFAQLSKHFFFFSAWDTREHVDHLYESWTIHICIQSNLFWIYILIIMAIFMFWISFAESFYIPQLSPNAFSAP